MAYLLLTTFPIKFYHFSLKHNKGTEASIGKSFYDKLKSLELEGGKHDYFGDASQK
jgi:hypothetical protein